jgi:AcrR family transcriptional regulator
VEEVQRTRILEAVAELMAERPAGAAAVGTAEVLVRAGVSRGRFDELFADRETCLLAAFELGVRRGGSRVVGAYAAEVRWRDGIKAGLAALLGFLDEQPALGTLCVVHSLSVGAEVLRRRMQVLAILAQVVDRGRAEASSGKRPPPPIAAEGVVGAVLSVLQSRMLASERQPLLELFGPLMSIVVLPYLGSTAARRELLRPPPMPWPAGEPSASGPIGDRPARSPGASTRLTYRTARVLSAIAEHPGASNREVAERAGVVDQGQISKLLSRLEDRRLIAKIGEGLTRGAPNAWRLTEHGDWLRRSAGARLTER